MAYFLCTRRKTPRASIAVPSFEEVKDAYSKPDYFLNWLEGIYT